MRLLRAEPLQRNQRRASYPNGYTARDLATAFGTLKGRGVPPERAGDYQTQVVEHFQRHEPEGREAITVLFVAKWPAQRQFWLAGCAPPHI